MVKIKTFSASLKAFMANAAVLALYLSGPNTMALVHPPIMNFDCNSDFDNSDFDTHASPEDAPAAAGPRPTTPIAVPKQSGKEVCGSGRRLTGMWKPHHSPFTY
jgi:hypothetical protein